MDKAPAPPGLAMARPVLAMALLLALAGCAQGPPAPAGPDASLGPVVEGWVVDARLVPVPNATVTLAGLGLAAATDAAGHYWLQAPSGADLVVVLAADGFVAQSRAVGARSGEHTFLNFTLARIPDAEPFHVVTTHQGAVACGFVAVLAEDPSRPHEHQGLRCSQLLNDTRNQWVYALPDNTTGIVVEVAWTAQSEVAQALVLKIVTEGSGEVLAFIEGTSVLRIQLSSVKLEQERAAGHTNVIMTLEPGAGTGNHEHGAAGAFVEQRFDVFATAFFNGPVDSGYSITRPDDR